MKVDPHKFEAALKLSIDNGLTLPLRIHRTPEVLCGNLDEIGPILVKYRTDPQRGALGIVLRCIIGTFVCSPMEAKDLLDFCVEKYK
jgi:hypothetical protein